MRALVVDPAVRTIAEIDHRSGDDARALCKLIGATLLDSGTIGFVGGIAAVAFVDDSGLLKRLPCFRVEGYAHPLAGKALVLGCDRFGQTVECPLTREELESRLRWVDGAHAIASVRAKQAIAAAQHRARGLNVETDEEGLVNVITAGRT